VRCERFREAYSAGLDDEPLGASAAVLAEHLDACSDCARWADAASRVTRLARLDLAPAPDLADAITAGVVLPARRVFRRRRLLRGGLLVTGIAQLGIGIPEVLDQSMGMTMAAHAAHEAAAWNLAIGAAFLAATAVPRRAAGLIPLLGTFTVVLAALSIRDLVVGAVTPAHLATHLAVVIGLGLLIALDRAQRALPPGRSNAPDSSQHERPGLRGVA
jgi:predicted anti-sigma-YlaC factor YlaD